MAICGTLNEKDIMKSVQENSSDEENNTDSIFDSEVTTNDEESDFCKKKI